MNCKDTKKNPNVPKEQLTMITVDVGLIAADVITWNSHLRLLFVQNEQKKCSATAGWQCGCPLQLVVI